MHGKMNMIRFIKNTKFRIYYISLFKIKTFIRRKVYYFCKFNRPSRHNFITGDSFRKLATHIYDEIQDINPQYVMTNDIVFVRGDFLHTYFTKVHPRITHQYILLSHNSDENIDEDFIKYIDNKIIHWFAQNLMFKNSKCTPLPIGLQLRLYDRENKVLEYIRKYKYCAEKVNQIFYAFNTETNTARSLILKVLSSSAVTTTPQYSLNREEYYREVARHVFNASPEGNGVDCNRTWETLYLGSIPILKKSTNSEYWREIGLPVLIIQSWDDIKYFNENFLEEQMRVITLNSNNSPLYMDYWIKEIYSKTNE